MSLFDKDSIKNKISELEKLSMEENFWNDNEKAQNILKNKKSLEETFSKITSIDERLIEIEELFEMAIELDDKESKKTVLSDYVELEEDIESLSLEAFLNEEYDANNAYISIHAGTGGVDACDWASILMRMYMRWAEKHGFKIKIIDLQDDTEAGIKSSTLLIEGGNAYGYLKSEKGVHRLIRISPYNASKKRQTSFALVDVMPQIEQDESIEISLEDLKIDTYRSSGAGGQSVNTTDSAIRITHIPTNIIVTCQNERSQHRNKEVALNILSSKLLELKIKEQKESLDEIRGDYSMNTWGSQIRTYVFHPYNLVKDHRTNAETSNVAAVIDGNIDYFLKEKLKFDKEEQKGK